MHSLAFRFIRWGTGFLILGLWTGYFPLHHYLHGDTSPSCPAAPIHAHVVLLGWVGMTLFGLVYRALGGTGDERPATRVMRWHFWLSVTSVLGVFLNGTLGYEWFNSRSPDFYYLPDRATTMLWFGIDGAFLTLFMVASLLFAVAVFRATRSGP